MPAFRDRESDAILRQSRRGAGFSMIETLLVVALMLTLLGLLIGGLAKFRDVSNRNETLAIFQLLNAAADEYANEKEGLYFAPSIDTPGEFIGEIQKYPDAEKHLLAAGKRYDASAKTIKDAWGTLILFVNPNTSTISYTERPLFKSAGPDRAGNTDDDLLSDGSEP